MSQYNTLQEFVQSDRKLRKSLESNSTDYLSHIKAGLTLFHTVGNHNVQIINDMLDTASAGKMPRNRIIDWLVPLVGHKVEKIEAGYFRFGGKKEDADYDAIVSGAPAFLTKYPTWEEYKKEADPAEFDAEKVLKREVKALSRKVEELTDAGYAEAANIMAQMRDMLKSALNSPTILEAQSANDAPALDAPVAEVVNG